MSSWVKVGAKCVCIEAEWRLVHPDSAGTPSPSLNEICTVTEVALGGRAIGIAGYPADWFAVDRFRPLIAKTQSEDIEMFLRIASKAPSNMETADA